MSVYLHIHRHIFTNGKAIPVQNPFEQVNKKPVELCGS